MIACFFFFVITLGLIALQLRLDVFTIEPQLCRGAICRWSRIQPLREVQRQATTILILHFGSTTTYLRSRALHEGTD